MKNGVNRHDDKGPAEVKASSPIRTSLYEREGSMWGVEAAFTEAFFERYVPKAREIRSETLRDTS